MRTPLAVTLMFLLSAAPAAAQATSETAPAAEPTLVKPPELRRLLPADLPPQTAFPAPEVEVVLEIDVDEAGAVTEVRLVSGPGAPFDEAALRAARAFEFEPALLSDGSRAPVTITFRMRIQQPPPPTPPPPPAVQFEGVLLERGTRRPLAGVEVRAGGPDGPLAEAVTDEAGRFAFSVAAARFTLRAEPTGHEGLEATVEARPGEVREESFYLETLASGFETVVRARAVVREVTRQVLPREVVERLPGTQGDTLKVVQNLPGVARAAFGGGSLILRGASPGDSRVFLQGQEIPILYHFGGLRSTFHPAFLEAVEFVPGNFGPDYGRAMGGIVEVRVRDPAADLFRGGLDLNFYDAGLVLEGPLTDTLSIGGAFHRSYIDAILPAVLPDDAALSFDSAPRYYDYQLLVTWRPHPAHKLRLIWYGSMDKVALLFKRPQGDPAIRGDLSARIMFHNVLLESTSRLATWLSQETSFQGGFQQFRTVIGPELFFDLDIGNYSFRTAWTADVTGWLSLRAGMDIVVQDVTIDLNSPFRPLEGENAPPLSAGQTYRSRQETVLYEPAAFLEARLEPLAGLTLLPSLRLDYYRAIDRWTVDPRLSVRYRLLPATVLKGGIGYYQQPPTPDQTATALGNPDLLAPRSSHSTLGAEQEFFDGRLRIEAAGFYKWLDRQVIRNPAFYSDPTAPPYLNGGTGRIYGLELLVRGEVAGLSGWLAYTWQRSLRQDGSEAEERRFSFDQPHILTLVGSYDFGSGWSAGLRFRVVSGNPDTPVVGAVYDAGGDVWVPLYGPTNSERQATFHQLDVRADKVWTFKTWRLGLYLDIQNLYNQGNQEGWSYSFDYAERQPLTGLPILPILGVKGEW